MTMISRSLLTALAAAIVTCTACSARRSDAPRLISIGTRSLWLHCRGQGSPTVVLEAGHLEAASTWASVEPALATFGRVCTYDRAGRGRSPPASEPTRLGRHVVDDLYQLLLRAGEEAPFVLVGHSLGAAFVRLYAAARPVDVAGLVLLDPTHEREFERIDALLTAEQRAASAGMRPMSSENFDIEGIFAEVQSITDTHLPVSIVARGRPLARDEVPPTWSARQYLAREQLRQALHRELAQRFPNGRLVIAPESGHFVHHDAPDIVIAEIRRIVTSWRNNGTT